jgi:predicted Zn-dependent protease with MMP-like domain
VNKFTDEQFDQLITKAMDELPQEYIKGLDNVAIVMADEPTEEQKIKMKIRENTVLLGLYEGIPMTRRGGTYLIMMPDKITLFKNSILRVVRSEDELFEQIKRTLWHEIAHFYGLDHDRMNKLQSKNSKA